MKKVIISLVLIGSIFACGYYENNYTRTNCEVIKVTETNCIIEDTCGFTWTWNEGGFAEGDIVNLKMCANGTAGNIKDDTITAIKLVKEGNR